MSCVSFAGRSLPNRKRLVFLGALDYWQGVDRAITLMEKLEDFQLSIIGDGRERKSLEDLVNTRNLSGRVVFKGILKGPALQDELRQHDIGIASLGVHRKDLTEACPLKTRHYLALGMPVIIGYHDVDLANDLPFVLKVPCNESPIDADSVRDFYFRLVNDSDIIKTIQTYANENLSSRRKMKTLSGFLAQVAHTRAAVTAS
jgi:glycosyltransferase involved in cell wall biosynthesis